MNTQRPIKEPMFNFSEKAPVYLTAVFILIYLLVQLLPAAMTNSLAPFLILRPLGTVGTDGLSHAMSFIGHGFMHGGWGHVIMNSGMIIVFGIATIRGIKLFSASKGKATNASLIFLLIFLFGVAVGGLFQWGFWAATNAQLTTTGAVGASGGASALFATAGWAIGGKDKVVQFGFGWGIINLVMVLAEPFIGISLAWPAHIGGYIGGMILAPIFVRANSTKLGI